MNPTDIAVTYTAENNPEGLYFDGVPLRDITKQEFDEYRPWTQDALRAAAFYTVAPEA